MRLHIWLFGNCWKILFRTSFFLPKGQFSQRSWFICWNFFQCFFISSISLAMLFSDGNLELWPSDRKLMAFYNLKAFWQMALFSFDNPVTSFENTIYQCAKNREFYCLEIFRKIPRNHFDPFSRKFYFFSRKNWRRYQIRSGSI